MTNMPISEAARRAGLAPSAIRYYESAGVLPKPKRINGRRVYSRDAVLRLRAVRRAREAGFTVSEVGILLGPGSNREPLSKAFRMLATRKLTELKVAMKRMKQLERLLKASLACHCVTLETCRWLGDSTADQNDVRHT